MRQLDGLADLRGGRSQKHEVSSSHSDVERRTLIPIPSGMDVHVCPPVAREDTIELVVALVRGCQALDPRDNRRLDRVVTDAELHEAAVGHEQSGLEPRPMPVQKLDDLLPERRAPFDRLPLIV